MARLLPIDLFLTVACVTLNTIGMYGCIAPAAVSRIRDKTKIEILIRKDVYTTVQDATLSTIGLSGKIVLGALSGIRDFSIYTCHVRCLKTERFNEIQAPLPSSEPLAENVYLR
jgi:hypothetical protein